MSCLLFNGGLKDVFNFPKGVEDILEKMQVEKNKRVQKTKNTLDLDDARSVNNNKTTEINNNTEIILGEKIFKTNTERVVDNLLEQNNEQIYTDDLIAKVSEVAEPLIAKYKEVYKATQAETNEVTKQIQEKVKQIAVEFNNAELKDSAALKQKLIDTIEVDFVNKKVTQKEEEKVEKVQKTKEEEIRDRLRSFTRTIPMFIMANDSREEITIDNFDVEIDDKDFLDLTSITKEEFHKLRDGFDYEEDGERKTFQGVFNKYRFNASIAEFRLKKEQLANYFTAEEDIFELIPNQKTNQIFTPKKVVQMMINNLEEHDPNLFTRTDSTFIDLYMKSGMYITEIVKKLFNNTRKHYQSDQDCLQHILENQVYGLAPTPILQGITQSYIFGFDTENRISRKNFIQHDISPEAKEVTAKDKLQKLFNLKEDMKFDAVVGNPPYQDSIDGYNRQEPIYQYFYDSAESIGEKYCLISPARFLFNAGLTKKSWNLKMLNHPHLSVIYYNPNSNDLFQNTDIKGGVAAVLYDRNKNFGAIKNFIPNDDLKKIALHFEANSELNLPSIMFGGRSDLKFNNEFIKDFPNSIADRLSQIQEKHPEVSKLGPSEEYELKSSAFEVLSNVFKSETPNNPNEYYRVLGLINGRRAWRWIEKKYMQPRYPENHNITKYKVFVPKANGSGTFGESLSTPVIAGPSESATPTFISIGSFDTEIEAANTLSYLKTKLLRSLLSVLKITQDNPPSKWSLIPIQDFSNKSDIDWSKSISELDQQLYKKYHLSKEEIEFIEDNVQPMN